MIEPNIYCRVSGMVLQCATDFQKENGRFPLIVEIGCADGLGTMRFAGFADRVICIDPMVEGRPDIIGNVKTDLYPDNGKLSDFIRRTGDFQNVELIMGCSLWPETINDVAARLAGRKIDVLVIDGCHHPFDAVWSDFVEYYPMVGKGGYVIFDDLYEECIKQAYEKARDEHMMIEHDRFSILTHLCMQDVASLKKTED